MEDGNTNSGGGERSESQSQSQWWWGLASGGQLGWGIWCSRRGCPGDSRLMPLKAFGVASLFVGAIACASMAAIRASGIHKVEDLVDLGANIRTGIGAPAPSRTRDD